MTRVTAPQKQPPTNEFGDRVRAHTRYVTRNGDWVPGVTTVLNLLAKPALVKWANRIGLEGLDLDSYVSEAAQTGSLAHHLIQCAIKREKPALDDYTPAQCERAAFATEAFADWIGGRKPDTVLCEKPLVSDRHLFGGTVDWVVVLDDVLTLVDWKTSAAIYPEHKIQASAYVYLLKESGYHVKGVKIIKIPRSQGQGLQEHSLSGAEVMMNWKLFLNLLSIYQLRREMKERFAS